MLQLVEAGTVTRRWANAVVLCGDVLRPTSAAPLTGRENHDLSHGLYIGRGGVADLVARVLPSLEKRLPVDVETTRLPGVVREAPRANVDARRDGTTLSVLATIVYGDPPFARVDGGELVHFGGAVPLRDEEAERRLVHRLSHGLGLMPGVRERFHRRASGPMGGPAGQVGRRRPQRGS